MRGLTTSDGDRRHYISLGTRIFLLKDHALLDSTVVLIAGVDHALIRICLTLKRQGRVHSWLRVRWPSDGVGPPLPQGHNLILGGVPTQAHHGRRNEHLRVLLCCIEVLIIQKVVHDLMTVLGLICLWTISSLDA
jgi:hypothetical protein